MHATEYDVFPIGLRSLLGKLQRIPAKIRKLHNLIPLVVVPQNHHVPPELGFCRGYPLVQGRVRHQQVRIEIAAHALLDFGCPHRAGLVRSRQRVLRYGDNASHGFSLLLLNPLYPCLLDEFCRLFVRFTSALPIAGITT